MGSKRTTEDELRLALETRDFLDEKISDLKRKVAIEAFATPPHTRLGDAFEVYVRFGNRSSKQYRYLLLRCGDAWYTTGIRRDVDGYFPNWLALVRWLRSNDVQWHSPIRPLLVNSEMVALRGSDDK